MVRVGLADVAVGGPEPGLVFTTSGLGSCVAIALYDSDGVGALLHAMLPAAPEDSVTPAKYVDTGIDAALSRIGARTATRRPVRAKLAGGSSLLDLDHVPTVGVQNVRAARDALAGLGVNLVAADTGGSGGRSVRFSPTTGDLTVIGPDHTTTL